MSYETKLCPRCNRPKEPGRRWCERCRARRAAGGSVEPMTGEDFIGWREARGFNRLQAEAALGISRETIRAYETGRHAVPRYIALACAAVAAGLPPY